jgi:predicted GIY-YIG superfamily endonuclease
MEKLIKDIFTKTQKYKLDEKTYLYFLIHKSKIVYIGITDNIHLRHFNHRGKNKSYGRTNKEFDTMRYIEIDKDVALDVEYWLVFVLRPKYNRMGKGVQRIKGGIKAVNEARSEYLEWCRNIFAQVK